MKTDLSILKRKDRSNLSTAVTLIWKQTVYFERSVPSSAKNNPKRPKRWSFPSHSVTWVDILHVMLFIKVVQASCWPQLQHRPPVCTPSRHSYWQIPKVDSRKWPLEKKLMCTFLEQRVWLFDSYVNCANSECYNWLTGHTSKGVFGQRGWPAHVSTRSCCISVWWVPFIQIKLLMKTGELCCLHGNCIIV